MTSEKQMSADREDAQKSPGPGTGDAGGRRRVGRPRVQRGVVDDASEATERDGPTTRRVRVKRVGRYGTAREVVR